MTGSKKDEETVLFHGPYEGTTVEARAEEVEALERAGFTRVEAKAPPSRTSASRK